nr:hypothetical protein [uncultured Anaerotignum sp.]
MSVYLQGLSLGLAYVAPIGMQNLFVVNSAMSQKLKRAIATALIVIFWDISLGISCFFGIGVLMQALPVGSNPYFISGFASASFLWFSSLVVAVHLLGRKINSLVLTWLNRICGVVIILYGIKLLYSLVQMLQEKFPYCLLNASFR